MDKLERILQKCTKCVWRGTESCRDTNCASGYEKYKFSKLTLNKCSQCHYWMKKAFCPAQNNLYDYPEKQSIPCDKFILASGYTPRTFSLENVMSNLEKERYE